MTRLQRIEASFGERPSHIWAQDYADARGKTHPVTLEAGEPTHYWSPGLDGGPDVKVMEGTGDVAEERHVQGPRTDNAPITLPVMEALNVTAADLADVPPLTGWEPVGTIATGEKLYLGVPITMAVADEPHLVEDTRPPHPGCATQCQEAEDLGMDASVSCVGGCVYRDHPSYAAALADSGAYAANPPLTQEGPTDGE